MKRVLLIFFCLAVLSGCVNPPPTKKEQKSEFISGVWITYSEMDRMLTGKDFKKEFDIAAENLKSKNYTDVFVSVIPFCNSLYKSEFYPQNEYAKQYGYDILRYICATSHKKGIKVHAWINPYRVASAASKIEDLPAESPVKSMKENEDYAVFNGIYLNPSSPKTVRLITGAVREICVNYDVDGIHFDDYFYPTVSEDFDKTAYRKYAEKSKNPLSLKDYRISSVNTLISSVYTAIKFTSKDIVFSISPAASIDKNLNEYYADVKTWCENGCVDLIIPQLYFGFEYPDENYRFDNLLEDWKKLIKNTDTALAIGLANYKINTGLLPDKKEWQNGEKIIKRQTGICRKDESVKGIVNFSYSYVFKKR